MAEKIIYDIIVDSKDATKAISNLNKETGKLDTTFEDVYGDIKPLTGRLGELQDRMYELAQSGDVASKEFKQLSNEASRLKTVQKDVDKQLDRTSRTLDEKFSNAVNVASSSMVLAEGAMSALGVSAKTSEESMAFMVQAIAGAQALNSLNESTGIFTRLGSVIMKSTLFTKAATVAQRLWNAAMSANPLGVIILAVTALIAAGYALIKMFNSSADAVKNFVNELNGLDSTNRALEKQSQKRLKDLETAHRRELELMKAQGKKKEEIEARELSQAQELTEALEKQKDEAQLRAKSAGEELEKREAAYQKDKDDETLKANFEAAKKAFDASQTFYEKAQLAEEAHQDKIEEIKHKHKIGDIIDNADVVVNTDDTEDDIIETTDDDELEDDTELVALGEKHLKEQLMEESRVNALISEEQRLADEKARIQQESLMFAQSLSGLFGALSGKNKALATAGLVLEKGAAIAKVVIDTQKANAAILVASGVESAGYKAAAAANALVNPAGAAVFSGLAVKASVAGKAKVLKNNIMSGISIATIASTGLQSRGGGGAGSSGGGGGSAPSAPTFNTVGQSPASANNVADNANSQIQNSNNNPTRAYVVSTDISSQQSLDRDIEEDNSLG
tara:strand:+ start:6783 stop:8645 length:1863 start_codon:yes stop_codon:yes gene_type:complete